MEFTPIDGKCRDLMSGNLDYNDITFDPLFQSKLKHLLRNQEFEKESKDQIGFSSSYQEQLLCYQEFEKESKDKIDFSSSSYQEPIVQQGKKLKIMKPMSFSYIQMLESLSKVCYKSFIYKRIPIL